MSYCKTVFFTGDPRKAREIVQAAMLKTGYKLTPTATGLIACHEGGFVLSQSGLEIYGASPITMDMASGQITLSAEYEGVRKATQFMWKTFAGLGAIFILGMGLPFAFMFPGRFKFLRCCHWRSLPFNCPSIYS